MKKIITLLSITIFTLGYSENKIQNKKINNSTTCYTQVIRQYENSKGEYMYSVPEPKQEVPCKKGQNPGSTTPTYKVVKSQSLE